MTRLTRRASALPYGNVRRSRGFTLIELMVAIAILAIISVMAFAGLSQVIEGTEAAQARVEEWQKVQMAFRLITQDLSQIHPRTTRDELGDQKKGGLVASPLEPYDVEFSRGGFANPAGLPRGTVLRVAYNLEGNELVRYYWPVMDRTLATDPFRRVLLEGIDRFEMTFLTPDGEAHLDWPPVNTRGQSPNPSQSPSNQSGANLTLLPRAVRISVEIEGVGTIWRLIEVGG